MMTNYEIDEACDNCGQDCYRCEARDECDMCPIDNEELLNSLNVW